MFEYVKRGQILSKYSIKAGGQIISKANSLLKWSGWYAKLIPAPPSIQKKPQFLKEKLDFEETWVKLSAQPQIVLDMDRSSVSFRVHSQTPRTVTVSTH